MAKKFLSFLGTTNYKECTYKFDESSKGKYYSKFIQEALIKTACKDWIRKDTAVIFLTEEARNKNWYNIENEERRLKTILGDVHINVKDIPIPDGKSEGEIWEIFDIVSNQIDENDEIIFDITHSFRSIPMLALVVLNYVKVVKNAKILGIYYGAYEAKDSENIAPVFDLTPLDEILEWSQAVNTFLKYGNSGHLKDISVERLKPDLSKEQWARDTKQFINSLNNLTMCLYTCRGMTISGKGSSHKSIPAASQLVKDNLQKIKTIDENNQIKPLVPLMEKIENRIDIFDKDDNLRSGIATVKWCIDNNLVQQAYTALDETMKTYVCMKFNLDPTNYNHREEIAQKSLKIKALKIDENKWRVKEKYRKEVKEIVAQLDDELISLSQKISNRRNDINHFGFRHDAVEYECLAKDVEECYKEFLDYLKENV